MDHAGVFRIFRFLIIALVAAIALESCGCGQDRPHSGGADGALDGLLYNLSSDDAKVRAEAAWALGKSGEEEAVEPLIRALGDDDSNVRDWAALGLVRIGKAAVPKLTSALEDGFKVGINSEGENDDERDNKTDLVRWQVAAALGMIGDSNASEPLRQALESQSSRMRYWSAFALGQIGENSSNESRESLAFALGDANGSVRYEAGLALRATEGEGAADIFIGLLNNDSISRRAGAARALGEGGEDRAVMPLVGALKDGEAAVRLEAARSLGRLADGRAAEPLVELLSDADPAVRVQAIASLEAIGEPATDSLVSALKVKVNAQGDEAAAGAAQALGGIGEERSLEALEEAFSQGTERMRMAAGRAMININASRTGAFMISLLQSQQTPAEVRADAAWALGEIGDGAAKGPLIRAMGGDGEEEVRISAARALKKIGGGEVPEYTI